MDSLPLGTKLKNKTANLEYVVVESFPNTIAVRCVNKSMDLVLWIKGETTSMISQGVLEIIE